MTSTITLYKDSKIIPSKNFVVDSLEDYLSNLTKITISDFQYLRNDLNLFIKINKSQDFTDSISDNNYNYLKVIQHGVSYYYFILKKTQLSQSTIGLELLMDVLNTYPWGTAFGVSNRTRVSREHKDRMEYIIPKDLVMDVRGLDFLCNLLNNETYSGTLNFQNGETTFSINCNFRYRTSGLIQVIHINIPSLDDRHYLIKLRKTNTALFLGFTANDSSFYFSFEEEVSVPHLLEGCDIIRNIDYFSEGFNPVLYKKELGLLLDKKNDTAWDLIYKNATDSENSAIDCLAVPEENTIFSVPSTSNPDYSNFEDGKYYLFAPWDNASYTIRADDDSAYFVGLDYAGGGRYACYCCGIRRSGTSLYIISIRYWAYPSERGLFIEFGSRKLIGIEKVISDISFTMEEIYYIKGDSYFAPTDILGEYLPEPNGHFSAVSSTSYNMTILAEVDRVDSKLVKIISIPYFPTNYDFDEEHQSMSSLTDTWTFNISDKCLQLNDLDINFTATIETDLDSPLNIFDVNPSLLLTELRDDYFESKLFHSDFYQPKFIYDSFGFIFELEKMSNEEYVNIASTYFSFEFIMTATINSKFLFRFPQYVLKMATEDYDNILPVARNNERPIYHSSYITYLRTAYRYDLKEKYQSTKLAGINMGMGIGNTLASAYSGSMGQNENIFGSIWSGISGLVGTFVGGITKLNNLEWSFQSKIESLKAQANSVSGSDDLDLMEAYASNRAKLCLYEVSPRMKDMLADLFYYFGYATEEFKIPSINTRAWFNFLSCELELTGISKNISDNAKDELYKKYSEGATFLHMNIISDVKTWDFDQVKENWETSLL